MEEKRLTYMDIAAGIMIVWVVLFHALGSGWVLEQGHEVPNTCLVFPYLHFFMPWFFYKSGMFFKHTERKELWKKDAHKLLKPFVIWSVVGYVLFLLFAYVGNYLSFYKATVSVAHDFILKGSIPVNEVLWFLLSLCAVRWIANEILPKRGDRYFIVKCLAIIAACYLITYLCYRFNHRWLPRWIANDFAGLAFYTLGYWLRDYEHKFWIIIPCAIVYLLGCFCGFTMVDMWSNTLLSGYYLLWIPSCFCAIVLFNNVCRWIDNLSIYLSHILSAIGRYAMPIYITHALLIILMSEFITFIALPSLIAYASYVILVGLLITLPLVCFIWKKVTSI